MAIKKGKYIDRRKFGSVFVAIHLQSNARIACKVVELPSQRQSKRNLKALRNETLSALIQRFGPFNEGHCRLWFAQMLSALKFMHDHRIAYRDLKTQNIFLDQNNHILISDFGMSAILMDPIKGLIESKTFCGTMSYMTPEVLEKKYPQTHHIKDKTYNAFLVDVWALGIILFQLFNKDLPFAVNNVKKALNKMIQKQWRFSGTNRSNPSPDLKTILKKILEPDPSNRPTMSKLTKYTWINRKSVV